MKLSLLVLLLILSTRLVSSGNKCCSGDDEVVPEDVAYLHPQGVMEGYPIQEYPFPQGSFTLEGPIGCPNRLTWTVHCYHHCEVLGDHVRGRTERMFEGVLKLYCHHGAHCNTDMSGSGSRLMECDKGTTCTARGKMDTDNMICIGNAKCQTMEGSVAAIEQRRG